MLLVEWSGKSETNWIPPFGEDLFNHIQKYSGAVKHSSCSAWKLLYDSLIKNGIIIDKVKFMANGKPFFDDSSIFFSLSHSKDLCAVAISDAPVGVDIERFRDNYKPHLIEKSLTSAEKEVFDGDFTRLWTRKESFAKLKGEGISKYPNDIDTTQHLYYEKKLTFNNQSYWLSACVR